MKRRIAILGGILLVLVVLAAWTVPAFAADPSGATQPSAQSTQQGSKLRVMVRLLMVQDEAKVDAFIAKAKDAGKITAEQATKIKGFWTNHHEQFAKRAIVVRLLLAKDGAKVQAFLDTGVAAGKITAEQADKIVTLWNKLHSE
jgi:hypothetical protein